LRAAGVEEISSEEIKGTCVEILTQCHSALAQTIGERLNRTVLAGAGVERGPAPAELACRSVRIQYPDAALAALQVGFSETLLAAIREAEQPTTAVAVRPVTGAPADPCAQAAATLDLLRDIELPVSVSFGRARLPLRDVLKLAAGSVIELDRAIEEPVALIVNNTVVALGEVVVVEGNYGVRIQQIMSREKLLTSSGLA
jgi:flagellar motor switch protein FliN/FliY